MNLVRAGGSYLAIREQRPGVGMAGIVLAVLGVALMTRTLAAIVIVLVAGVLPSQTLVGYLVRIGKGRLGERLVSGLLHQGHPYDKSVGSRGFLPY